VAYLFHRFVLGGVWSTPHADTSEGGYAMDGATLGMGMTVVVAVALVWWGLHSSPIDAEYIDRQADEAFRFRTTGKSVNS
jgi:hypothetical protein